MSNKPVKALNTLKATAAGQTITIPSGTAGNVLTVNALGGGGSYGGISSTAFSNDLSADSFTAPGFKVTKDGDVIIDGELVCKSLDTRLKRIEAVLRVPPEIKESKELKQQYKELIDLKAEYDRLTNKYLTWENMKKEPK